MRSCDYSDFNEKILKAQNSRVSIKPNHASPHFPHLLFGCRFSKPVEILQDFDFPRGTMPWLVEDPAVGISFHFLSHILQSNDNKSLISAHFS